MSVCQFKLLSYSFNSLQSLYYPELRCGSSHVRYFVTKFILTSLLNYKCQSLVQLFAILYKELKLCIVFTADAV